jgi:hypothetical protein
MRVSSSQVTNFWISGRIFMKIRRDHAVRGNSTSILLNLLLPHERPEREADRSHLSSVWCYTSTPPKTFSLHGA